jgi:copper transport protein
VPTARAGALLVALFALARASAQAHAYLVGAQPPIDGSYVDPVGTISISFDEPIDIGDSDAVEVDDFNGVRVDRHDASIDPNDATRVIVHVPKALKPGVYSVRWRVISADTHVVHGRYQLGVGIALAQSVRTADGTASPFDPSGVLATLVRALSLVGATLAAGSAFMRILLLEGLTAVYDFRDFARKICVAGGVALLVAAPLSLLVQASAAGGSFGSDLWQTLSSRWGVTLAVRVLATVAIVIASVYDRKATRLVAATAGLLVLGTFSATGHAVASGRVVSRVVALAMDFAHVVAATTWVGGIFVMVGLLYRASREAGTKAADDLTWILFARFTPIATACVCIIALSGTYASFVHVPSLHDLSTSTYGRLLLAKIALFIVLLAFGYRHMRIGYVRKRGFGSNTLALEGALGTIVLFLTAALIGQMPPHNTTMSSMPISH